MGIRSSSTRQVILQDARIPIENVLGEIGQGHRIALNVLNVARYRLCAASVGGSKHALALAARYAANRKQFGRAIATFGLIQQKLAGMVTRIFAAESALYRTVGLIDARAGRQPEPRAVLEAVQEYAGECAILKVLGTETLDYCVDEALQVHGGYGFLQDFPIERAYRDSRINRLFEGTNEINRLLAPTMLSRRARRGELDLSSLASLAADIAGTTATSPQEQVARLKALAALLLERGLQASGERIEEEQELLGGVSDILIETYAAESALARAAQSGDALHDQLALLWLAATLDRAAERALRLLPHYGSASDIDVARRLTAREARDAVRMEREVARWVLERGGYPIGSVGPGA